MILRDCHSLKTGGSQCRRGRGAGRNLGHILRIVLMILFLLFLKFHINHQYSSKANSQSTAPISIVLRPYSIFEGLNPNSNFLFIIITLTIIFSDRYCQHLNHSFIIQYLTYFWYSHFPSNYSTSNLDLY